MISIKKYKKMGKGVVATQDIKKTSLILQNNVLILPEDDVKLTYYTKIRQYLYQWSYHQQALALGLGSLFNHSEKANIEFKRDFKNEKINYYALRDIKKGEQLFINYGYDLKECLSVEPQYVEKNNKIKEFASYFLDSFWEDFTKK